MKSAKTNKIEEFWAWFKGVSRQIAIEETPLLLKELDVHLEQLAPMLSWEIGPGLVAPRQLVISPNLDRAYRAIAKEIISLAPVIDGWEFHSARQPKLWDYKVELARGGDPVRLDASNWTFVLLRYPEGEREILLKGDNVGDLTDEERWQAAAIVLESILGEDILIDTIEEFALVDRLDPQFSTKQRPIKQLREAVIVN